MAVLTRNNFLGNIRLDLTDAQNLENFVCSDFTQLFKQLWNSTTQIVRGYRVFQDQALTNPAPTVSPIFIELEGAVLIHSNLDMGPLFFVGAAGTPPAQISLTANTVNYIEADLGESTGSADTRTFWDPTANNGAGAEFAQVVDTVINVDSTITVNTAGFSGGNKVPIAQIELDSGGSIVALYDRRNLFFRLGRGYPYNDDYQSPFVTGRNESVHTLTLTGGSGTFTAGEVVTGSLSLTTAKVVSGGTTSITITAKDQPTFTIGETITGTSSGASRDIAVVVESFNSSDKDIHSLKDLIDALMSEIVRMKFGTTATQHYWFEDAVTSLRDARPELFMDGGGDISWNSGTGNLSFTSDFIIPITNTLFTNTIQQSTQSPINLDADGKLAYIDVSHSTNANLTVNVALQSDYQPQEDRFIIARRIGTSVEIEDRLQ